MYKLETHLHTRYSSICSELDETYLIPEYLKKGFLGLAITDHYNRTTFQMKGIDLSAPGDKLTPFLEGYYRMKEAGEKEGMRIYRGAEIRFDENGNDYLLFDFPDDLLADPEAVFTMGLEAFSAQSRAAGAILIQAHPFRKHCVPANPRFLDGVEIRNTHPHHDSQNLLAEAFGKECGGIQLCGSDCHHPNHQGLGGILSETLPEDDAAFAKLIRSGTFLLL